MIELPMSLYRQMQAACEAAYSQEACGALLGNREGRFPRVTEVHPLRNAAADPLHSYAIDPAELAAIVLDGRILLGLYHSHADAPDTFSDDDLRHGFCHWHYLVFSIIRGRCLSLSCWQPQDNQVAAVGHPILLDLTA